MNTLFALLIALLNYGAEGCVSLNPQYPDRMAQECETVVYESRIIFENHQLFIEITEVTDFGVDESHPLHRPQISRTEYLIEPYQARQILDNITVKGIEPYFCSVVELETN